MDRFQFQSMAMQSPVQTSDLVNIYNQARQNPRAFEEHVKRNNPQAYQRAHQLKNSVVNPQEAVLQIMQQRGINPNIISMINL